MDVGRDEKQLIKFDWPYCMHCKFSAYKLSTA